MKGQQVIQASVWHIFATPKATNASIIIPETQSQEKIDTLRTLGAEVRLVPAVPYKDPQQLRQTIGACSRRTRQRDLGKPIRELS